MEHNAHTVVNADSKQSAIKHVEEKTGKTVVNSIKAPDGTVTVVVEDDTKDDTEDDTHRRMRHTQTTHTTLEAVQEHGINALRCGPNGPQTRTTTKYKNE